MEAAGPGAIDFYTEAEQAALKNTAAEHRELDYRMRWISDQLLEFGSSPEELMFGYFNECMRITTESRGVMGAYLLAQQLQWHVVQLIGKLHSAGRSAKLSELPPDPTVNRPDKSG